MLIEAGCDEKLVWQLLEFFKSFDKDNSKSLDMKELRKMLGKGIPKHWFDRLAQLFDGNGDKEICFREFGKGAEPSCYVRVASRRVASHHSAHSRHSLELLIVVQKFKPFERHF